MDNSIVVIEETLPRSDSVTSTSKFGSIVEINSIEIDISSSMEVVESPKHEHFSIRGFVAGMRRKDQKKCFPFALEANEIDLVDNLPPLSVPRFRWWQCLNCAPGTETMRITEETVVATRSDAHADSCQFVEDKNALDLHCRVNTGNKGKTDSVDKEIENQCDTSVANPLQIIDRLNIVNTTGVAERPSCAENASSGSGGTFSALPHKRKPKLRSLADIMVKERNPTSDNPRTRSVSSCGMQVASTETEAVLGPQPELDVAKAATTSPERKRKCDVGEIGEPLRVIYPSAAAAKSIKGPLLDTGKHCRRIEVSNSKSEGDASMRLDFRLDARTQRIRHKKNKALGVSKKMKLTHRENGAAPMREFPQINGSCSANLQKQHAVPLDTSYGKLGCAASITGEMRSGFRSSKSGQQIEKIFGHSNSKTGEVELNHELLMPPRKSNNLGDCNIRGKAALDLSLYSFMDAERISNDQTSIRQHRAIPDLNEESPEKADMTQGQLLTNLSEKRSLPLQKTLDASGPCINETTREGKRQLRIFEPKNKEQNVELGRSDDIPMEIVELLAQKQHERGLENSRRHLLGINTSTRGYSALYVDGRPSMLDLPLANRKNGLTVANGNMEARQSIPMNFPQLNNCRLNMSKPEESQFRLFSSSTPNQQRKAQYAASSSTMAGPRCNAGDELLWSSMRESAPFHLGISPKHSIQPSSMGVHSFSDRWHKGKTISDIKDSKGKRAVHNSALIKEGRMGPIGSLDPYSNDTIPAMQLLSLMDQRVVSGSSFESGTKRYLDKSFSPCDNHPRLNGKENQNYLSGSLFSQNSHSKHFSGLGYGVYSSGESSKKASANLRVQIPEELGNSKATLFEGSGGLVITQPASRDSALGVCTLNRNPSDFSIPDATNKFTLSAKDFKPRKRNASKEKSRMVNMEGRKRQRMRKDVAGKEYSRK